MYESRRLSCQNSGVAATPLYIFTTLKTSEFAHMHLAVQIGKIAENPPFGAKPQRPPRRRESSVRGESQPRVLSRASPRAPLIRIDHHDSLVRGVVCCYTKAFKGSHCVFVLFRSPKT
jgi:hypothetical protein